MTSEVAQEEQSFGFSRVYAVELKYRHKPEIDRNRLYASMERYTGSTQQAGEREHAGLAVWEPDESGPDDLLHFFHLDYKVAYSEGEMPAQTSLMPVHNRPVDEYATAVQQSWHWREAGEVVSGCGYTLLLTDLMASGLKPQDRLQLMTGALRAVLEAAPCDAVYFRASDKLVEPQVYLAALEQGELLYGAMNIRFYNVEGTGNGRNEGLMDSLGLAALGIPDVQCHFFDLDPSELAGQLMDVAYYLFRQGDVIEDGETIGFTEEMRWRCEHQYALAEPQRVVIDIDPGAPYYAGRQENSR